MGSVSGSQEHVNSADQTLRATLLPQHRKIYGRARGPNYPCVRQKPKASHKHSGLIVKTAKGHQYPHSRRFDVLESCGLLSTSKAFTTVRPHVGSPGSQNPLESNKLMKRMKSGPDPPGFGRRPPDDEGPHHRAVCDTSRHNTKACLEELAEPM